MTNGEKITLSLCEPLVRLTRADIGAIMDIEQCSFPHPWSREFFLSELSRSDSYCYGTTSDHHETNGALIAYICYRLIQNKMHLLKIAVAPAWRCRGVASVVLRKCLGAEEAKGITASFLEVRPSNLSAIAVYDRLGYQTVGKQPNYYADNREDAIIMMKPLKEEP
ncbi:MAG: ribosomal protein S18-alanine N-acetyltransferase [Desulfobacterales bacterium]